MHSGLENMHNSFETWDSIHREKELSSYLFGIRFHLGDNRASLSRNPITCLRGKERREIQI